MDPFSQPELQRNLFSKAVDIAFAENVVEAIYFEYTKKKIPEGKVTSSYHIDAVEPGIEGDLRRAMATEFFEIDFKELSKAEEFRIAFIINRSEVEFYKPLLNAMDTALALRLAQDF